MKRIGVLLILFLAFCGIADSVYLTQHEINGSPLLCNINGLSGCNVVAQSAYSHIFGIPLAEYGLLFYGALFVLAALELVVFDQLLRRVIQFFAIIGVLASIVFSAIQVFVIGAICIYCMGSAVLDVLIFIAAWCIEPVRRTAFDPPLQMPPSPARPGA